MHHHFVFNGIHHTYLTSMFTEHQHTKIMQNHTDFLPILLEAKEVVLSKVQQ